MTLPLILASESPRRLEILRSFSIPFEVIPHTFDERTIPWDGAAHEFARKLSESKALNVAERFPSRTIVAADTIVVIDGKFLGKPKDRDDASRMLRLLSGQWHHVITGVAVVSSGTVKSRTDETRVLLQPLSDAQINTYLNLTQWKDKAAGYAIQGAGAILVQRIEGCFYNVIGLPVVSLASMLSEIGIDLWRYL
jgi:septum formation protein